MNSRHCETCVEDWPKHLLTCPVCAKPLKESSKQPMTEDEYRWLLATKKGRYPEVPKSEAEKAEAEWQALEAEAERRGPRWSVVDLLEEGWDSVRHAA